MMKVTRKAEFDLLDCFLIILLSCISFGSRTWQIHHPTGPVFDEVHFGNFTNWYTQSQFYFDIHPPLAKLIMFYFANLSEYNGEMRFNGVSQYSQDDYVQLRFTNAFFSSFCAPLIYLSLRFTQISHVCSFMSSILILFDTSMATEGHFILSDGILHFFCCLHIAVLSYTFSLPKGKRFNVFHILNGLTLGCACSCKNTAWGLMAFDAYVYIIHFLPVFKTGFLDYLFEIFIYGVSLFLIQFIVYCLTFYIHFIILPYAGQGEGYLPENMKYNLIKNSGHEIQLWGKRIVSPGLLYRSIKLTLVMHNGNMQITQKHPSQSFPAQWPLLTGVDVYFWAQMGGQQIRCYGNFFVYYFVFIGIVVSLFTFKSKNFFILLRFTVGWAVCYFPMFLIPRSLYLYHYLIPLIFGSMAFGAVVDLVNPKIKGIIALFSCALVIFGYWIWSPYVYGLNIHDREIMELNKKWVKMIRSFGEKFKFK